MGAFNDFFPFFGIELAGDRGGIDDVGEEDGDQLALAFGLDGGLAQLFLQGGRGGLAQNAQA